MLAGLFKVCEIRPSAADLKELAAIIGPGKLRTVTDELCVAHADEITDCTPKAVTHQLAKFRTQGASLDTGAKTAKNNTDVNPIKVKGAKGGKGGKKGAKAATPEQDDNGTKSNGALTPPPTNDRPKRAGAKRDYAKLNGEDDSEAETEKDEDVEHKKIKTEEVESGEATEAADEGGAVGVSEQSIFGM